MGHLVEEESLLGKELFVKIGRWVCPPLALSTILASVLGRHAAQGWPLPWRLLPQRGKVVEIGRWRKGHVLAHRESGASTVELGGWPSIVLARVARVMVVRRVLLLVIVVWDKSRCPVGGAGCCFLRLRGRTVIASSLLWVRRELREPHWQRRCRRSRKRIRRGWRPIELWGIKGRW